MGRALDRLPLDYEEPRTPPRSRPEAHEVPLVPLPPTELAARNAAARSYLLRKGHADLLDVLGLGAAPGASLGPYGGVCPNCEAPVGQRCVSKVGKRIGHPHAGRVNKTFTEESA